MLRCLVGLGDMTCLLPEMIILASPRKIRNGKTEKCRMMLKYMVLFGDTTPGFAFVWELVLL